MLEILPTAALLLLVQPVVQQPPSVNGIDEVTIAVVESALESSLRVGKAPRTIRLRTEQPSER